jgi:hypothetical protein
MHTQLSRRVAGAVAAAPLLAAGLVAVGAASPATAVTATCTPSVLTTPHTAHLTRPAVQTGKVKVKRQKKGYTATGTASATYWTAVSVSGTQVICSGDIADTPLTYTATVAGTRPAPVRATVKAKGHTKAQAKKAEKKKLKKAVKTLGAKAASSGLTQSPLATATAQVRTRLTGTSHVAYLSFSGDAYAVTTQAPAGAPVLGHTSAGDPVLTFPAGYDGGQTVPCLTKATTWPSTWVFDGGFKEPGFSVPGTGTASFSNLPALQTALGSTGTFDLEGEGFKPAGKDLNEDNLWFSDWNATGVGLPLSQRAAMERLSEDVAITTTASFLCFDADTDTGIPAEALTLHDARIGSGWTFSTDGRTISLTAPVRLVVS